MHGACVPAERRQREAPRIPPPPTPKACTDRTQGLIQPHPPTAHVTIMSLRRITHPHKPQNPKPQTASLTRHPCDVHITTIQEQLGHLGCG